MIIRIQDLTQSRTAPNYYAGEANARHVVHPGDLLISWAATLDAFIWNGPEAVLNQHIFKVRSRINTKLHYYAAKSAIQELYRQSHGTGMVHVTKAVFESIPLLIPNDAEDQERLAARLDELSTQLVAANDALRVARKRLSVYRSHLIGAALKPHSRRARLKDVAEIRSGFGFPKSMQGRTAGDIPVYKVGDISRAWRDHRDWLDETDHYLSMDEVNQLGGRPVPRGATVFAKIGEAVKLNRRALLSRPSGIDNNVMAVVPSEGLDPRFLFIVSKTWDLSTLSQATTVPSVRKSDIGELPVPIMDLDEQRTAVEMVDRGTALAARIDHEIERSLGRSDRLWTALLANAFRATRGQGLATPWERK